MSRARQWLLRGLLGVASLGVFLGGVELALRAADYGGETAFFVPTDDGQAWTTAHDFGRRFDAAGFRVEPRPVRLARPRPDDEIRVVLLGGSAAFGDRDPATGPGPALERLLSLAHPELRFRVINAALPGAGSQVVRGVARDALVLEPDLFVVYLGNHEIVGAAPAAGGLTSLRVAKLAGELRGQRSGPRPRASGAEDPAPPPLAADDERVERSYARFSDNLDAVLRTAHRASVPLLLSTVPVNLVDSPPQGSLHRAGLEAEALERWREQLERGRTLSRQRRSREALEAFAEAAAIDDRPAELAYAQGRALLASGDLERARRAFVRARDLDTIRSRADTGIDAVIRDAARRGEGVELVDALQAFDRPTPGRRLFYDPIHLTLRGSYELARAWLAPAQRALGLPVVPAAELGDLRRELPVTAWDRYRFARNHSRRGSLPRRPPRAALLESVASYRSVLEVRPDDLGVRERLAELALFIDEPAEALREADALVAALSRVPRWQRLRGVALARLDAPEDALSAFTRALALDPNDFESRVERASLREELGDRAGAREDLEAALALRPEDRRVHERLERAPKR